jgi:hypothetical protein
MRLAAAREPRARCGEDEGGGAGCWAGSHADRGGVQRTDNDGEKEYKQDSDTEGVAEGRQRTRVRARAGGRLLSMATNKDYQKLRDYVPRQSLFQSPTEPTGREEDGRDVVDEIDGEWD